MKKLLLAAFMLASSATFAQTKFGIKAGVNFANQVSKEDGSNTTSSLSYRTSYNFGFFTEVPVSDILYIQPGLSISDKGARAEESGTIDDVKFSYKAKSELTYIEAPINAILKFKTGNGNFLLGAGPYLALGLSGKYKYQTTISGNGIKETESENGGLKFGNDEDEVNPIDFGLNFLAGYELKNRLSFNAGYGMGLANISNLDDSNVKHKVFSLSVGFKLL